MNLQTSKSRIHRRLRNLTFSLLALLSLALTGSCAHNSSADSVGERQAKYFGTHPNVPREIAKAIRSGRIVLGMDREQVSAALGEPLRRKISASESDLEWWLYPSVKLLQDHFRSQGAFLFKIVFRDGRVASIDAI